MAWERACHVDVNTAAALVPRSIRCRARDRVGSNSEARSVNADDLRVAAGVCGGGAKVVGGAQFHGDAIIGVLRRRGASDGRLGGVCKAQSLEGLRWHVGNQSLAMLSRALPRVAVTPLHTGKVACIPCNTCVHALAACE